MLVDEYNSYILPLLCVAVKCGFNGRGLRLGVDDEEVLLGVWWLGNML